MKPCLNKLIIVIVSALLGACAGQQVHKEGLRAYENGDYETAISKLGQAVKQAPDNLDYRLDFRSHKELAVQDLIAKADDARARGNSDQAAQIFRRVLAVDPGNERGIHGLSLLDADKRHAERVSHAQKLFDAKNFDAAEEEVRQVLSEESGYAPALNLAAAIDAAKGPVSVVPQLKARDSRSVTLQFRDAPTKMVFEVLARQTGLNFIFDKDIKSDGKTTIFVSQVSVEQAIDLILAQNQLSRQILSDNMVLIYPATPAKQKDYQEEVVHIFTLANATPKDAESMLKTVLGAKTLYVDERSNTVIMRDTPEHIRMAERLITSLDMPESEVILEVEVLEAQHTLLDQLGIRYPTSATLTPNAPASALSSSSSGLTLAQLGQQSKNTITVTPLSVGVDLLKTVGQTNVLSSPRIRAKNKEKAKIMIGDRVPVVTSGAAATTGGTYSTSSVQYLEVGLSLDVQPTIHMDGNVQIKMNLEVSSIVKEFDVATGSGGNTHVYQIGTRNASTTLELRDGETQVLGGLITNSDQKSSAHIPGLGDFPVVGRLFGSDGSQRNKSEIVLSITPRVIRTQAHPSSENAEFWFGTESQTRSAPFSSGHTAATGLQAPASAPATGGGVSFMSAPASGGYGAPTAPAAMPARIDSAAGPAPAPAKEAKESAAAGTEPPATQAGAEPAAATEGAPKPHVTLVGPDAAKTGEEFDVAVRLEGGADLSRVRTQVRFDAAALQLLSATPGDIAGSDAKVEVRAGGVQADFGGESATPAGGSLMNLRFKVASARGSANVATQVVLVGDNGAAVAATQATPLKIAIQ